MTILRATATIAEMQARDLSRRRLAVVMLAALPLLLYLSVPPGEGWELTPGAIGLSWSVGGVALFSTLGWRQVDARLSLAGYGATAQLLGRLVPLAALGLLLAGAMIPLLLLRSQPADGSALALAVVLTVLIGGPMGLAIGALFARELEGMLALIAVGGVAMSLPPDVAGAAATPLWGPVRLVAMAYEGDGAGVAVPTLHSLVSIVVLGAVTWFAWSRRVRVREPDPLEAIGAGPA
ncbi:hypothetical protein [Nocardioides sp.]|uniref:hypothetical protein n=1 Tax=Nocardioides sp. TaxID=35761 RepID=UPI0027335F4E|nr:hypothetical protein [Nocardioides sp.]MDP3893761.1 hypothetical protein [Nocardioides sp.]